MERQQLRAAGDAIAIMKRWCTSLENLREVCRLIQSGYDAK
jgi:hypothetical protein